MVAQIEVKFNSQEHKKLLQKMERDAVRAFTSDLGREVKRARSAIAKRAVTVVKSSTQTSSRVDLKGVRKRIYMEPQKNTLSIKEVEKGFRKAVVISDDELSISSLPDLKVKKKRVRVRRRTGTRYEYRYVVSGTKYRKTKEFRGTWLMKKKHWKKRVSRGVVGVRWESAEIKLTKGVSPAQVLRTDKTDIVLQQFADRQMRVRCRRLIKGLHRRMQLGWR